MTTESENSGDNSHEHIYESNFIKICRAVEGFCRRPVDWSETTATGRFVKICAGIITFVSVIFIFIQLAQDFSDRSEDRAVRREERIERAWTRLLTQAGGNTGKGFALSVLLKEDQDIQDLDMSCKAVGGWDTTTATCTRPAIFADVDTSDGLRLQDSNAQFAGNQFVNSNLNWVPVGAENFQDVYFVQSTFSGSIMAMPSGAFFHLCDMSYAQIFHSDDDVAPAKKPIFFGCNMSGIRTDGIDLVERAVLNSDYGNENWAWADAPPSFDGKEEARPTFEKLLENLTFCDPKFRENIIDESNPGVSSTVQGVWPKFSKSSYRTTQCTMSWREAAAKFPSKYP